MDDIVSVRIETETHTIELSMVSLAGVTITDWLRTFEDALCGLGYRLPEGHIIDICDESLGMGEK